MGPFEMVVAIIAIVTIGSIIRAKHSSRREWRRDKHGDWREYENSATEANQRLREEMKGLKERVAVLERLATDSSRDLDQQIEQLRDRNRDRV